MLRGDRADAADKMKLFYLDFFKEYNGVGDYGADGNGDDVVYGIIMV